MRGDVPDEGDGGAERQRVVRVRGARRARLTPAPGTDEEPLVAEEAREAPSAGEGPNDERMRREVPPHY